MRKATLFEWVFSIFIVTCLKKMKAVLSSFSYIGFKQTRSSIKKRTKVTLRAFKKGKAMLSLFFRTLDSSEQDCR